MAGTRATRYRRYRREVAAHSKINSPGKRYGHTLDHIVPISFGFNHDIDPNLIGSRDNLQLLPFQDNIAKGATIDRFGASLLRSWGVGHLVKKNPEYAQMT